MQIRGLGKIKRGARRLRNQVASGTLILMYHRVAEVASDPWGLCVTPQHFAEHLEVLQRYTRPLQLQQLTEKIEKQQRLHRSVVITFDDGYADNFLNAKPLLEKYKIPATVFVASGYVDQKREFWWDELEGLLLEPGTLPEKLQLTIQEKTYTWDLGSGATYSEADRQAHRQWSALDRAPTSRHFLYYKIWDLLRPLGAQEQQSILDQLWNWAGLPRQTRSVHRPLYEREVIELAQGGLIEVGAHTINHPSLPTLTPEQQYQEIQQNKARLEKLLNNPVTSFAYPYGDYNSDSITVVQNAGFQRACSTIHGSVRHPSHPFELPRVEVRNWNQTEFSQQIRRWFDV